MNINIKFIDPISGEVYEYHNTAELARSIGMPEDDIQVSELERRGFKVVNSGGTYFISPDIDVIPLSINTEEKNPSDFEQEISDDIENLEKSFDEEVKAADIYKERANDTHDEGLKNLYHHIANEELEHKSEFLEAAGKITNGEKIIVNSPKKECVSLVLDALSSKLGNGEEAFKRRIEALNSKCDCKLNANQLWEQDSISSMIFEMNKIFNK